MGLKGVTGGYREFQRVARGLSGLQGITAGLQKKFFFSS